MELMVVWLVAAVVVGAVAASRNRSGFIWFMLAIVISPVLAGLLLAVLKRGDSGATAYTADTHRNCPECREVIRVDARLCKHCGSKVDPITRPPS
jgi:hypothetical protein